MKRIIDKIKCVTTEYVDKVFLVTCSRNELDMWIDKMEIRYRDCQVYRTEKDGFYIYHVSQRVK